MKKIKTIITIIFLLIALSINVYAATGSFSVSKSAVTLTEGKSTTFNITAKNCEGKFTISSSNSGIVKVSTTSEWVTGSTTVTLTAVKPGSAKITVKASDVGDTDEKEVTGSKTISVTVKEKATNNSTTDNNSNSNTNSTQSKKSNNAYLSTLGITPKEYDFSGFSKTKTSYSVTVPSTVDSLKVIAKAADPKATVKISGNSGFEVGSNNKIKVVVTAEDGKTTKTYTIKVTKLAEDEEKPGNVIEDDKGLYLTSLSIEGIELSPKFEKDNYSYTATLSDFNVNEVNVKAVANKEKANIDISGNTNLVVGENTINLVLTLDGSTEQTVYQIVLTKEGMDLTATNSNSEATPTSNNDLIGTVKKYIVIAITVVILMILSVIILVILLRRENKKLKEDNDEDEDTEEYNVYKNDVNEFENIEKENFIESLYNQKDETELDDQDKQTIDEINNQTKEIFQKKQVEGQSVEYESNELEEENSLEERKRRRGKHF